MPPTILWPVLLQTPVTYPDQFPGLKYPNLNGSLRTIAYEFRAYLLIRVLGRCGPLKPGKPMLVFAAGAVVADILCSLDFKAFGSECGSVSSVVEAKWPNALVIIVGNPVNYLQNNPILVVELFVDIFEKS
jgi:hypothetical protein